MCYKETRWSRNKLDTCSNYEMLCSTYQYHFYSVLDIISYQRLSGLPRAHMHPHACAAAPCGSICSPTSSPSSDSMSAAATSASSAFWVIVLHRTARSKHRQGSCGDMHASSVCAPPVVMPVMRREARRMLGSVARRSASAAAERSRRWSLKERSRFVSRERPPAQPPNFQPASTLLHAELMCSVMYLRRATICRDL